MTYQTPVQWSITKAVLFTGHLLLCAFVGSLWYGRGRYDKQYVGIFWEVDFNSSEMCFHLKKSWRLVFCFPLITVWCNSDVAPTCLLDVTSKVLVRVNKHVDCELKYFLVAEIAHDLKPSHDITFARASAGKWWAADAPRTRTVDEVLHGRVEWGECFWLYSRWNFKQEPTCRPCARQSEWELLVKGQMWFSFLFAAVILQHFKVIKLQFTGHMEWRRCDTHCSLHYKSPQVRNELLLCMLCSFPTCNELHVFIPVSYLVPLYLLMWATRATECVEVALWEPLFTKPSTHAGEFPPAHQLNVNRCSRGT